MLCVQRALLMYSLILKIFPFLETDFADPRVGLPIQRASTFTY